MRHHSSIEKKYLTFDQMLSADDIRVLDLLPPEPKDNVQAPIYCRTRVVSLSNDPDYETLSYVWGDGRDKIQITVDDCNVAITKSLETALKRIRPQDNVRVLWIDQLCINQNDDAEKAVQVPLMDQIYSGTSQCLIWFGEIHSDIPASDAIAAFELIHYLNEYDEKRPSNLALPNCLTSAEAFIGPVKALRTISRAENPWWHRIWTLQEAVLPSQARIIWGPLSISWETVEGAAEPRPMPTFDRLAPPHALALNAFFAPINALFNTKAEVEGPLNAVNRWSFRKATNPLDHVYGFLGLFPRGTLKRSECCNYQLSAANVYAMFTIDLIEHHRSLHPIAMWSGKHLPGSTSGMPSWALDMAHLLVELPISIMPMLYSGDSIEWFLMNSYDFYNASASADIDWQWFGHNVKTNVLTLTGRRVGDIRMVGNVLNRNKCDSGKHIPDERVIEYIGKWYECANTFYEAGFWSQDSHGPALWPNSFWRGLIGNYVGEELKPKRAATPVDLDLVQQFVHMGKRSSVCLQIFATMCYRTMFMTKEGWLGFGPRQLVVGDQVWILRGGKVPFVLRPWQIGALSSTRYSLVGPAYVDGMMYGEIPGEGCDYPIQLV